MGIASVHEHLPATATQAEVEAVVARFNADPAVNAYLVQLPLPDGLDEERALLAVDPAKDVDGLHPVNLGRLVMGAPGPLPCTPAGIVELLQRLRRAGRGAPRGGHRAGPDHRPAAGAAAGSEASRLQRRGDRGAHRACDDLAAIVRTGRRGGGGGRAGRPGDRRHGQARGGGGRAPGPAGRAGSCSPTSTRTWPRWPGGSRRGSAGVGPMTRAMLLRNAVRAAERAA